MKLNNPFADYGGIVADDRFIGRNLEVEIIKNRLLGAAFGNIAVMGLPRIGKSSLAWNSIFSIKADLIERKILPVWISFGQYSSLNEMFEDLISELSELLGNDQTLNDIASNFAISEKTIEKRRYIKRYLKSCRSKGFRVIIVLDEFDNAQNILSIQDFQFLREISYNLDIKVGLLTVSRKTIQELEPENGALSNFYQIFTDLRLKMFSEQDMNLYWNRIEKLNINVTQKYIFQVKFYTGTHPYLLDLINNSIFNQIAQSDINLDEIFTTTVSELQLKIYNEYEAILKLMSFEGLERTLVQVIIGPVYDIVKRDVEKLLKYDLASLNIDEGYSSFCPFFTNYLNLKSKEMDIWPLWTQVEQGIRQLIKQNLERQYGENWSLDYQSKGTTKEKVGKEEFIKMKTEMMEKNVKSFGNRASKHLVDYTYPMEMFDRFIALEWQDFKSVFGKEKGDWRPIFEHLGKIRNPLAHNNPEFLSDADKSIADGYCKMILEKLK